MSSEQLIASAKSGLTDIRNAVLRSPSSWYSGANSVRTYISYIDQSGIMANPNRVQERLWFINEVQHFAYFDADNGGVQDLSSWCEREWNRVLGSYPGHVEALKGLGQVWLSKAQFWLAKIQHEERSPASINSAEDDTMAERRRHTANYVEARAVLMPAVDFFGRCVHHAKSQNCLTGDLLTLRAEACMSLGNVSNMRDAQKHFRDALLALRAAEMVAGYMLPPHLSQYLRENEYILSMR